MQRIERHRSAFDTPPVGCLEDQGARVGLGRIGGKSPQSQKFLREAGISLPASTKRALTRLVNLEFIYGPELEYKFFDPFFRQWILRVL